MLCFGKVTFCHLYAVCTLHNISKNVYFMCQDPVLFSGTVRKNLDPFNLHTDEQVWNSLEEVGLLLIENTLIRIETTSSN